MHPQAGASPAPLHGAALSVGEIDELLAGEERVQDERDGSLHPGLVLGVAHPGRVDVEPPRLGVLDKGLVQPRIDRVGAVHDRRQVVRDDSAEDPTEERPRRLGALDHRLGGLAECEPQELMARSSAPAPVQTPSDGRLHE
jgi:hypothetical protein